MREFYANARGHAIRCRHRKRPPRPVGSGFSHGKGRAAPGYTRSMKDHDRLVPGVRDMGSSATLDINERCKALAAEGREIFRLGLGQSPFPVPDLVVAALREHAGEKDYLPVAGLPELRWAVADYYRRRHQLDCDAAQVLIGPGSKQLLFLLQVIHKGTLLLPTPCWVTYAPQASVLGRKIRFIPTRRSDRWRLQPEDLDAACRQPGSKVLLLNYPDNPTGQTYTAQQLAALARVARKHRLVVVADEIYGELDFDDDHRSMAAHYAEGTIVSAGLSKWCGAGGWRLGTFVFPPALRGLQDAMMAVASETHSSVSAPVQYAAVVAYRGGKEIEDYLRNSRRIMGALLSHCAARLRAAGLQVAEPQGGFYFLADFETQRTALAKAGIENSAVLCNRLLQETGVALLPGAVFGREPEELLVRAACVDFDGTAALRAAARHYDGDLDNTFLAAHCARVLEACQRLADWCKA